MAGFGELFFFFLVFFLNRKNVAISIKNSQENNNKIHLKSIILPFLKQLDDNALNVKEYKKKSNITRISNTDLGR